MVFVPRKNVNDRHVSKRGTQLVEISDGKRSSMSGTSVGREQFVRQEHGSNIPATLGNGW